MKCKKSITRMSIKKRKCKNLTDVRTVFFLLSDKKYKTKNIPNGGRIVTSVFNSNLSWQKRKQWIDKILEWKGKKGENFEWQCVLHNSTEKALELKQQKIERVKGKNNPAYNHGGKFSVFSDKCIFTSSKEEAIAKMRHTKANNKQNQNTCIEYYLNKGLSEEDAKLELTKRQATNSLERYVKKYGKVVGPRKYKERNDKWQHTLNSKSIEERARINSLKCSKGYSVSKAETELFNVLKTQFSNIQKSLSLSYDDDKKYYVYDIVLGNKIIEYNGDFWHANPKIYDESFINRVSKLSSKEIWEKEINKEKVAFDNGYNVLRIWESDYKQNKDKVINECINFLT